jgi:hypothetical protein
MFGQAGAVTEEPATNGRSGATGDPSKEQFPANCR